MAIYHCSIKPVSRGAGRSAPAAAAYRAGVCLSDSRTGEVHDYTRRSGVLSTALVLPPGVEIDRAALWDAAEGVERRKDARVAREIEIALPAELTREEREKLALEYARGLVKKYGVAADVAIHAPSHKGDQRNHHAHILITTRQISASGLGEKTDLERDDKALRAMGRLSGREQVEALRAEWATRCNVALERAGHHIRLSHKSLAAQGIDREPTIHLGPTATEMERQGVPSERGAINARQNAPELARIRAELAELEQQPQKKQAAVRAAPKRIIGSDSYRAQPQEPRQSVQPTAERPERIQPQQPQGLEGAQLVPVIKRLRAEQIAAERGLQQAIEARDRQYNTLKQCEYEINKHNEAFKNMGFFRKIVKTKDINNKGEELEKRYEQCANDYKLASLAREQAIKELIKANTALQEKLAEYHRTPYAKAKEEQERRERLAKMHERTRERSRSSDRGR